MNGAAWSAWRLELSGEMGTETLGVRCCSGEHCAETCCLPPNGSHPICRVERSLRHTADH